MSANDANRDFEAVDLIDVMDEATNYNDFLVREVIRSCSGARSVLDFGAGNGRAAIALKGQGFEVHAVEPDPGLREAISRHGIRTYPSLDDLGERSFDRVYSLNVLEHIEDDSAALQTLFDRLRPGGRLLLYVPAFDLLFTANDRRVGHFRRYSKRRLVPVLRSVGFDIERARYVDSLGFLVALAYRCIGDREGGLERRWVRFYDRAVFPLSRVLDRVLQAVAGKNLLVEAVRR